MDENRAVELLNKALRCMQTDPRDCEAQCKKCKNYAAKEDGIEAIRTAIKALGKDTNVPTWIPVSERLPEEGRDVLITKESFKIKGYEQKVIKAKRSVDPRSGKIVTTNISTMSMGQRRIERDVLYASWHGLQGRMTHIRQMMASGNWKNER